MNFPRLHLAILLLAATANAQTLRPHPQQPQPSTPTKTFHDATYKISFAYPATWNFSTTDRDLSTFRLDVPTAPRRALLRAVTSMPENPFPDSTFSGAYVYLSVTPNTSAAACTLQATPPATSSSAPPAKPSRTVINDIPFSHGHAETKSICITQRDEIYTTRHAGACYRLDLAINNFCGGEVSSVRYITPTQLNQVRTRLESILNTIHLDPR